MVQKERKTYTREYKIEAVRLVEGSELPMSQIARQLGVHRNMLANWRKKYSTVSEQAKVNNTNELPQKKELEVLRQEVKALKQERDILKKALAIISREQS